MRATVTSCASTSKVIAGGNCSYMSPSVSAEIPAPPSASGMRGAVRPWLAHALRMQCVASFGSGLVGSLAFKIGTIARSLMRRVASWISRCSLVRLKSIAVVSCGEDSRCHLVEGHRGRAAGLLVKHVLEFRDGHKVSLRHGKATIHA